MSWISFEKIKSREALAAYCATLIAFLTGYAMSLGIDGVVLAATSGVIGGLGGFSGGLAQKAKQRTE